PDRTGSRAHRRRRRVRAARWRSRSPDRAVPGTVRAVDGSDSRSSVRGVPSEPGAPRATRRPARRGRAGRDGCSTGASGEYRAGSGRRSRVEERALTTTTPRPPPVAALMAELSDLADPRIAAVNSRHGDDHAVNLTALRAV